MRLLTPLLVVALAAGFGGSARAETVRAARYELRVKASGLCLDPGAGNTSVHQRSCDFADTRLQFDVTVASGDYYRLVNVATGLVLDVTGASTANGADVITWTSNGGYNQQFRFERDSTGYVLRNRNSGKCVDLRNWNTDTFATLQQSSCVGSSNQAIELVPVDNTTAAFADGRYTFRSANGGNCLDVPSSSLTAGQNLQQYTCNGTAAQQYDVVYVGNNVYEIRNANSGQCVDLESAITWNNQPIQQYTCNQSNAQRWYLRGNADGSVEVASALDATKIWDVYNGSASAGASVNIYDDHNGTNQRWWLDPVVYGPNVADGTYTFKNVYSGKCIDVPSSSSSPGTQLQQYTCNSTVAQMFRVTHVQNGYYSIVNVNSGLALNVSDYSQSNGAAMEQRDSHGGDNQLFQFVPYGSGYRIRVRSTNRCVDINGSSLLNGAKVQQYDCNGSNAQTFQLAGGNSSSAAGTARNAYPIVLVHGLMGWGRDEMLGLKYWGGGIQTGGSGDIQEVLNQSGYTTFTAATGPLSSARDRAIELFYQIKGGCIDYGPYHSTHIDNQDGTPSSYTIIRRLDGGTNPDGTVRPRRCWARDPNNNPNNDPIALYPQWGDDPSKKIHLIGHSFGGPTMRILLHLLRQGDSRETSLDPTLLDETVQANPYTGGKNWVASLTAVSAVQNGTSFDSSVNFAFSALHAVAGAAGAVMGFTTEENALFNLKMDQWGLMRNPGESMSSYWHRVESSGVWSLLKNTADWDLGPEGMIEINNYVGHWNDVYYFSFSGRTTWREVLTGHELPILATNAIISVPAIITGQYTQSGAGLVTVDSTWWPNDGLVNVINQRAPAGDPSNTFQVGMNPTIGSWNLYPTLEGWDHLDFANILSVDKSRSTLNGMYQSHAAVLRSLGN